MTRRKWFGLFYGTCGALSAILLIGGRHVSWNTVIFVVDCLAIQACMNRLDEDDR